MPIAPNLIGSKICMIHTAFGDRNKLTSAQRFISNADNPFGWEMAGAIVRIPCDRMVILDYKMESNGIRVR